MDLNLFLVLHAVASEGSVTAAARRLHVTQSAVSNALGRLRALVGDPLFVRSGRRLVATARAQALAPQVAAALHGLRAALDGGEAFDPATSTRRFVLASTDDAAVARWPVIAAEFARRLPRASLALVTTDATRGGEGLAAGDFDVVLGALTQMPADTLSDAVFIDEAVCVVGRHNAFARLTMQRFLKAGHVRVDAAVGRSGGGGRDGGRDGGGRDGGGDEVDAALARLGQRRRVVLTVPHVAVAAMCLVGTPWVATLPHRAAEALAKVLPLRLVAPPLSLPVMTAYQVWHARTDADPGARVFREVIRTAAGKPPHRVPRAPGSVAGGAEAGAPPAR